MRTRIKTTINSSVGPASGGTVSYVNHYPNGTSSTGQSDDWSGLTIPLVVMSYETSIMQDSIGNRKVPNNVRHLKESCICEDIGQTSLWPSSDGHYSGSWSSRALTASWAKSESSLPALTTVGDSIPGAVVRWPELNDSTQVQQLYNRAVRPVADMLLNEVEAYQLASLHTAFIKNYEPLKNSWNQMNSTALSMTRKTRAFKRFSKLALRKLADMHLTVQFGILPLISDITALTSRWDSIGKQYTRLKQNPLSRVSSLFNGEVALDSQIVTGSGTDLETIRTATISCSPVERYVLRYKYRLPNYLNDGFGKMSYYASRMATGPASLLWELVPFSFVVDWFIDTSSLVMSLDNLIRESPIETISCTRSRKYGTSITRTADYFSHGNNRKFLQTNSRTTSEYSLYERVCLSRDTSVSLAHHYGMKQVGLSAALALQKFLKAR